MLVLSRKQGETIELPSLGVVVRVIGLKKSRIELGIEAPRNIAIHRGENLPLKITGNEADPSSSTNEFSQIEARITALSELSDPSQRAVAKSVAADAIHRLGELRKASMVEDRQSNGASPLSDFVKVRTDVLDQLRQKRAVNETSSCVRQTAVGYAIGTTGSINESCAVSA